MKKLSILIVAAIISCNSSFGEAIYADKIDLMEDQMKISDATLSQNKNHKSEYLQALRNMGSKNPSIRESAQKSLYKLREEGVLDALYSMYKLKEELGITENDALNFLKEAAEKGHAISQEEMYNIYRTGGYKKKDPILAHVWIEKSANLGNRFAMRRTAIDYFSGNGVSKNDGMGFYWVKRFYQEAGGKFDAWDLLGTVYETGRGTPVDLVKAYMCYDLEGTAGIEEKARIAPKMTAEQRAEGLRLSREWQEKNHVYTMQSLGLTRQQDGSYR